MGHYDPQTGGNTGIDRMHSIKTTNMYIENVSSTKMDRESGIGTPTTTRKAKKEDNI
jgi:hypothetical protein